MLIEDARVWLETPKKEFPDEGVPFMEVVMRPGI